MRKTKTVTIKAASLEEIKTRVAAYMKSEGSSEEETANAVAEAKAETPGRDEGKSYLITEMPVLRAEKWAARVLISVGRGDKAGAGIAGLLTSGISGLLAALTGIAWEDAEPLLDEMLTCVQMQPSFGIYRPLNMDIGDIEEIGTLLKLRQEILALHISFFAVAGS